MMRDDDERLADEHRLHAARDLAARDPNPSAPPGAIPAAALSIGRYARARAAVDERIAAISAPPPPPPVLDALSLAHPPLEAFGEGQDFVLYLQQLRDSVASHVEYVATLLDHKDQRSHAVKTYSSVHAVVCVCVCVLTYGRQRAAAVDAGAPNTRRRHVQLDVRAAEPFAFEQRHPRPAARLQRFYPPPGRGAVRAPVPLSVGAVL
jgi:hypothetical protein